MKKTLIILSLFAIIAGSCRQALKQAETANNEIIAETPADTISLQNNEYEQNEEIITKNFDSIFTLPYNSTVRITPDKSAVIDTVKRAQCQQTVEKINAMQLKCDTIIYEHFSEIKRIYFDKNNRLRKYSQIISLESGASQTLAYYDEKGNLVYITSEGYNNCESSSEYFYVHNGRMIDFMAAYDCGCCEEHLAEWEKENITRPTLGNMLAKSITRGITFANFIYANKLLTILKSEEYSRYDEFEK